MFQGTIIGKLEIKLLPENLKINFGPSAKNYKPTIKLGDDNILLHDAFKILDQYKCLDPKKIDINLIYHTLKDVSNETAYYMREQVFEQVRINNFPSLPSRHKCIWLTDSENLGYWKTLPHAKTLLTLELNGDIFYADNCWLNSDTFSSIEYEERALYYWNGCLSNMTAKEYLFYGEAIVTGIENL